MIPVGVFNGRRVAVFGLATSGIAAARALAAGGAEVAAWDDSADARNAASDQGIPLVDLASADWSDIAVMVLTPGVPLTHPKPHWSVDRARKAGVEVIGDTELFFRARREIGSKSRVIGITGTNGKSTISALVDHLLAFSGHKSLLGGNIGTAILDLDPFGNDMTYTVEFSSYQLDLTPSLELSLAVLLNIAPDHLERHGSFENYARLKSTIFNNVESAGLAVVGIDDDASRAIADALAGDFDIKRISAANPVETGVFVRDAELIEIENGHELASVSIAGIASLLGVHNWQNAAAAYAAARGCGLEPSDIERGLRTFPGLAHRMEQIGKRDGVLFINDSKATNTDAAAKALACFDEIYWIAGGEPKEGGLAGLEGFFPRIRRAYLIGEAADTFAEFLDGNLDCLDAKTMDAAVAAAARDAANEGAKNPVVLLSPACASFDQFPNFAARGEAFRAAVAALERIELKAEDEA